MSGEKAELVRLLFEDSTGRSSGIEGRVRLFGLYTFRGGKLVRMEFLLDEAEALACAGLSK